MSQVIIIDKVEKAIGKNIAVATGFDLDDNEKVLHQIWRGETATSTKGDKYVMADTRCMRSLTSTAKCGGIKFSKLNKNGQPPKGLKFDTKCKDCFPE